MKNIFKIIWSDEALKNLNAIIFYLENNWTENELKQFTKLLDGSINTIAINPNLFPIFSFSKDVRRCVISKRTSIFYHIVDSEVRLITLFDNRQNSKRLRNQL